MKPLLLSLTAFLLSSPAVADTLIVCKPTASNGLGLSRLEARISSEHPEAHVSVWHGTSRRPNEDYYSFEGHDDEMTLTGDLSVRLKRVSGRQFEANVGNGSVDTFSLMTCTEMTKLYYIYDFTGANFKSDSYNMMDDGLPYMEAFAFRLTGELGKDFKINVTSSNPTSKCGYKLVSQASGETLLEIIEDLEVDSGDTCIFEVKTKSGKKAIFDFYSTGT